MSPSNVRLLRAGSNPKVQRYPDHLGRTVLWVTARTLYGVREHPEADLGEILVGSWL